MRAVQAWLALARAFLSGAQCPSFACTCLIPQLSIARSLTCSKSWFLASGTWPAENNLVFRPKIFEAITLIDSMRKPAS